MERKVDARTYSKREKEKEEEKMKFDNSRRLTWFTLLVATGLCVLIVFKPSPEASQVLMLSIPAMLGLVGGWTHVVNRK